MRRSAAGFTLLELIVVLAIAGLLVGFAVPGFQATLNNAQRREAATGIYTALTRARSEAIARNFPVTVCARDASSNNPPACATAGSTDWKNGWIVATTGATVTQLQVHDRVGRDFTLRGVASPLEFDPGGRIPAGVDYQLCKGVGDAQPRRISVSRSGRVSLEEAGSCAS